MKRLFLQKIDPIMEERKMLNMQIQSNLPHDTFATRNALTYIKVRDRVLHAGVGQGTNLLSTTPELILLKTWRECAV